MSAPDTFVQRERAKAEAWKRSTETLPDEARQPAPYIRDGEAMTGPLPFCLPPAHAARSLLPEVRAEALELFAELGIPWHAEIDGGPSNHLLSSQVQCANALGQMVHNPERLSRAFGALLDVDEVLEVEPGRYLSFEYIGPTDYFGESPGGTRTRGARCTSVDAAFLHRTTGGLRELVLVEWKYTESYRARSPEPAKDATRWQRYGEALTDPEGPVRADLLAFDDLLQEPFYQLMRQQLLAWRLEREGVLGADRVRVVHVMPRENRAYQRLLDHRHHALGETVSQVWQQLLRAPSRFLAVDSANFLDSEITSHEYIDRYGDADAEEPSGQDGGGS